MSLELAAEGPFEALDETARARLASAMDTRDLRTSEILCQQGEHGDSLLLVIEGEIAVLVEAEATGEALEVARVQSGAVLGLVSLAEPGPRSATLKATCPTRVAELSALEFEALWDEEPALALRFQWELAQLAVAELRNANRRLRELSQGTLRQSNSGELRQRLVVGAPWHHLFWKG